MSSLSGRINKVIVSTAARRNISNGDLCKDWSNEIKSVHNRWQCLCDAGLCGSSPPRGVIFSLIIEWLCIYVPEEDILSLVQRFRSKFQTDPGLDGCLLELEEICKLKSRHSFQASLLTLRRSNWIVEECIDLPPRSLDLLAIFLYVEDNSFLEKISNPDRSQWKMILLPIAFDVIDVVLVDLSSSPVIYGIQITRSVKPFAKHHTFDTCTARSKTRLEKLWSVILKHFQLVDITKKFFVMRAPNCAFDVFSPPPGHLSNYYFSPSIEGLPAPLGKKRRTARKF